ncbi:OLC1v1032561C1 [Oldenlandia corymbosa var. corymbosa]|uniref:OLC1v1032561C1 n=1 Tax=Oldenlandia corymbosa var. corymbosa TaxID=529605 RepID=A0AAV1CLG7_OLDCO|nr:OLC1v1032561C1 [Oldenlandia corymbosa var. corymbosa]
MEGCEGMMNDDQFPGFQIMVPDERDEFMKIRRLSRLQRRAPRPLQVKPPPGASICSTERKKAAASANSSTTEYSVSATPSNGSNSTFGSNSTYGYHQYSKDPIPLLSPLVLPSLLQPGGMD